MAEGGESGSATEGDIVFSRSIGGVTDEDWDDTALIEAYDHAVGGIYKELHRRKEKKKNNVHKWKIGAFCRAQYADDGQWYEAKIVSIDGDSCTVQYLGYLNEEEQPLSCLKVTNGKETRRQQIIDAKLVEEHERNVETCRWQFDSVQPNAEPEGVTTSGPSNNSPAESKRKNDQMKHEQTMKGEGRHKRGIFLQDGNVGVAFPPPPPPFPPSIDDICGSDEALAAMLMSWYISGYHTGYYQAMRQIGRP